MRDLMARRVAPSLAQKVVDSAYAGADEAAMIVDFLERKYRGKDLGKLLAEEKHLASAFRKLSARNLSILPVVENQQLVGIVTLQNLMHSMALLAETRKLRKAALES